MSYSYNNGQYSGQRYASGNGHNRGGNRNFNDSKPNFKKSGFEEKTDKHGAQIYVGWRKTKDGLMIVLVSEYKNTETKKDKKGREYTLLMAKIQHATGESLTTCLHYAKEGVFRFPALGLTASLRGQGQTKSGKWVKGFFGRVGQKNNRR